MAGFTYPGQSYPGGYPAVSVATNYADSLLKGSYVVSGKTVVDVLARNDTISAGAYAVSGKTVTDIIARADVLSVGAYAITGGFLTDVFIGTIPATGGGYGRVVRMPEKKKRRNVEEDEVLMLMM